MSTIAPTIGEAMPTDNPEHLPPTNLQAEEALLGAIMHDPRLLDSVDSMRLRATDFYRPSNRLIFEVMRDLYEESGQVDELLVVNELKQRRKLTAAGGPAHVLGISTRCPATANWRAYAEEIINQATLRSLVETGHAIAQYGYEGTADPDTLVEMTVGLVDQLARKANRGGGDSLDAATLSEWLVKHTLGQIPPALRYEYPFRWLQHSTGGFGKTEVISIGAYSSDGKSAFKNQLVLGLPKETRIGVFSLEMEGEEEQLRFASALTGIEANKMWKPDELSLEQREAIIDSASDLEDRQYTIHSGVKSIQAIYAEQRRQKYDVVIIDHFHLLPGTEKTQEMAQVANRIKHMAMDTKCCVVLLFQLNRSDDRTFPVPNVNRVRGGNALLDASNTMMFLYRERKDDGVYPDKSGRTQLIMAKNRGGKSGYMIPFRFVPERVAFEELPA